jgi:hypothetical protein
MKPQLLLVLGMHRSGTSAMAGVLHRLGAEMPGELMPAAPGNNEKGFYESQDLFRFHEGLLAEAGSSWDDPLPLRQDYLASSAGTAREVELADLLARDYATRRLTAVKDPRICRLVPMWRRASERAGLEPAIVLPLRNPVEVAASLNRRDGFDEQKGELLWLRHVISAERDTRGMRRVFTTYDGLLRDPISVMERVQRELGLDFRNSIADALQGSDFLDPELRHNVVPPASPLGEISGLTEETRETWRALNALVAQEGSVEARLVLDRVDAALQNGARVYGGYLDQTRREMSKGKDQRRALEAEINSVRGAWEQAQSRSAEMERSRDELDQRCRDLERSRRELEARLEGLQSSLSWRVTRPLRSLPRSIKGLVQRGRQGGT